MNSMVRTVNSAYPDPLHSLTVVDQKCLKLKEWTSNCDLITDQIYSYGTKAEICMLPHSQMISREFMFTKAESAHRDEGRHRTKKHFTFHHTHSHFFLELKT